MRQYLFSFYARFQITEYRGEVYHGLSLAETESQIKETVMKKYANYEMVEFFCHKLNEGEVINFLEQLGYSIS
jgi:hypothetical protein